MHTLIVSTPAKESNWCKTLNEISYTRNITYHSAIKTTTPHEAIYDIEPHREVLHVQQRIEVISDSNSTQLDKPNHNLEQNILNSLEVEENDLAQTEEHQRKRMTISENRASYNEKMVQQSKKKADKKCSQFKVEDVVSIKINKVNKMTPFTPNMLIGKITEIENHYARVLTRFGKIQSLIRPTRLNLCTATNLTFDYSKEVSFTSACKKATFQNE